MSELQFPQKGDFFSVACTGWKDNSYKTTVFECTASDDLRVVCKAVFGSYYGDGPAMFYRGNWRFDDVSALLDAIGVTKKPDAKLEALKEALPYLEACVRAVDPGCVDRARAAVAEKAE